MGFAVLPFLLFPLFSSAEGLCPRRRGRRIAHSGVEEAAGATTTVANAAPAATAAPVAAATTGAVKDMIVLGGIEEWGTEIIEDYFFKEQNVWLSSMLDNKKERLVIPQNSLATSSNRTGKTNNN